MQWNTESFTQELNKRYPNKFIVDGSYKSIHTKIRVRCCKCDYEYDVDPNSILNRGVDCPRCTNIRIHNQQRWTLDDFKKKVSELVGESYIVIGPYIDSQTKIKMKHLSCGHIFSIKPNAFINGHRCNYCHGNWRRKSTEGFKQEINRLTQGEYELVGEYQHCMDYVRMKHLKCGNCFKVVPNNFLRGSRCPLCSRIGCSRGEQLVKDYLENMNIKYIYGYVDSELKDKKSLHFDFLLTELNIAIEYDGIQHFKPIDYFGGIKSFQSQQVRDKLKDRYCKDRGIKLIRIPYTVTTVNQIKEILSKYIPDQIDQNDQDTANLDQNKQ